MALRQKQVIDVFPRPGATTLVLLHGGGLNRAMWRPQAELLRDEYSLLLVDLPGHGGLDHTRFSLDAAVDQVAEVIASNASGRVVTLGVSLGGYVAMAHAAQYPGQVAGLMVSGSCAQYTGWLGWAARLSVAAMGLVSADRYAQMQTSLLRRILPADQVEAIARAGFSARGSRDSLAALVGLDFFRRLQHYPGPVLIANGERDTLNRKYAARAVLLQRGTVETLRHCGHLCSLQQPQAYADIVRKFTGTLTNGETREGRRPSSNHRHRV